MKSYTDLEQSKKLAEILPPESADLWWDTNEFEPRLHKHYHQCLGIMIDPIPCWSLAALLDILPAGKVLLHDKDNHGYKCICNNIDSYYFSNPIDTCVDIIIKLHEQKLL